MEHEAQEYINRIDEMGGTVAAIEQGFQQKEIADAAYRYQRQVDSGEKVIVGVNRYQTAEEARPNTLKIGMATEQAQLDRLRRVKEERDEKRLQDALAALQRGAADGDNLLPLILDAVRAYGTVGEVSDALTPVFGRYREVSVV